MHGNNTIYKISYCDSNCGGPISLILFCSYCSLHCLDAPPSATLVTVDVLLDAPGGRPITASIVDDRDIFHVAHERSLGEVGVATSPLDRVLGGRVVTNSGGAKHDLHGGLGETGPDVPRTQVSDNLAIDTPGDSRMSPLDGVGMEGAGGVADAVETTMIKAGVVTLVEVVGLNLAVVDANPFPSNLREHVNVDNSVRSAEQLSGIVPHQERQI